MTEPNLDTVQQEAIAWCVRVRGDMEVVDWEAFQAWLDAAPAHRDAYDAVEAYWEDFEAPAARPEPTSTSHPAAPRRARHPNARRAVVRWSVGGLAAAAAIVLAVMVARPPQPAWQDYATPPGQLRTLVLDDGSRLVLGPATTVRVRLASDRREVQLVDGSSAFDVAHQPGRPFLVTAGDRHVRVIGTEFDIVRRAGQLMVTVRRGRVAVSDPNGAQAVELTRGQQLRHREGAADQAVRAADPDQAFGWTHGQLYYEDTPLAEVAADFSRYGPLKVRVDASAAALRISGVFKQDTQAEMIRRLEAFSPVSAQIGPDEIILKAR